MKKPDFTNRQEKEHFVQNVFSHICKHYDLMNTILSFNQDKYWRRFALRKLNLHPDMKLLDIACGTGMLTKEALTIEPELTIEGIDFNEDMLKVGYEFLGKNQMLDRVHLQQANAMELPFNDNSFDACMNAFALRNVPSIEKVLAEAFRVCKPGGKVVSLELSKPSLLGFREIYYLYFEKLLPLIGKLSRDNSSYGWLPQSLRLHPAREKIKEFYEAVGFINVEYFELTGGIATCYVGHKPQ